MKPSDWGIDDRYPRQRVTIYAPDEKTALMGHVPYSQESPRYSFCLEIRALSEV